MRGHQIWDSVEEYNSSRRFWIKCDSSEVFWNVSREYWFWPLESASSKTLGNLKTLGGTCYLRVSLKSITASNITRDSRARVNPLVSVKVANIAHACLGIWRCVLKLPRICTAKRATKLSKWRLILDLAHITWDFDFPFFNNKKGFLPTSHWFLSKDF